MLEPTRQELDETAIPTWNPHNLSSHWLEEALEADSASLIQGARSQLHGLADVDPVGTRELVAAAFELGRRSTKVDDSAYAESCLNLIEHGPTGS